MKFEKGQRVRLKGQWYEWPAGTVGIVESHFENCMPLVAVGGRQMHVDRELVEPAPQPTSAAYEQVVDRAAAICERALAAQEDKRTEEARLADSLVELLRPYAGESGKSEGAVECLARIIQDRKMLQSELTRLQGQVADACQQKQRGSDILGERDTWKQRATKAEALLDAVMAGRKVRR